MNSKQQKLLVSLQRTKKTDKRIRLLMQLAEAFNRENGARSLAYAQEALQLAEGTGDRNAFIECHTLIADAQFFLGNYSASLEVYDAALSLCTDEDVQQRSGIYRGIPFTLSALGQFEKAIECLQLGIEIERQTGSEKHTGDLNRRIGQTYSKMSDYKRAFDYVSQAITIAREVGNRRCEAYALHELALIYTDIKETGLALETLTSQLPILRELEDDYMVANTLGNIALIYHERQDYGLALEYHRQCQHIHLERKNSVLCVYAYCNIANTLLAMGEHSEALNEIEKGVELARTIGSHQYVRIVIGAYYGKVLNKLGNHSGALEYLLPVLSEMDDGRRQEMHCMTLEEIVNAYQGLGNFEDALRYLRELMELKLNVVKQQTDRDLQLMESRHQLERTEIEKEAYRLKAQQLEQEMIAHVQNVTKLGLEVIERNEFLSFIKLKAKEFLPSSNGSTRSLLALVKEIELKNDSRVARQQFSSALKKLHGDFDKELMHGFPELTAAQRKVCSLIKLGLNSPQIANLLYTSVRTIEGHRLKIRKKMRITAHADIRLFLDHYYRSLQAADTV